jgi:two-component system, OmpR family, sensor histidine kinase VicK
LYGVDNVIDAELEFFANSKKRIDTCMNHTRPSLAVMLEPIKKAFLDAKGRGVKLRYLTEITHDNIAACKELMTIVHELRHLDGIKGNFMVSETEYLAPLILFEKGKIASQIICSNVKEILDQHQYMFDTLWNKAISAQQRIREIDEGIVSYETKVLEEDEKKTKRFKGYLENSNQLSVCTQDNRLQFVYNNFFKVIEQILDKSKNGEHKGIKWLTSIKDKDSANLAKIFLDDGVVIRHINQIPISFGVSDKEVVGSIANTEGTEMAKTLFVSNEPLYVEHFNGLFEELWKNGIDADDRIREVEEGLAPVKTKILKDENEIINEIRRLNNSASRLSICSAFGGMQMSYKYFFDTYKKIVECEGMRCIVNMDKKDSLDLIKVFLNAGIQVRHVKNMPPMNFGVSDNELAATIEKMEGGKMSQSFLISNEPLYINHFNSIFEELWKNGIDAKWRIKAIEEGVDSEGIEIIQDPAEIQKLGFSLIQTAIEEILVMYSTANAFHRQEYAGGIQLLKEAATRRGVKVRILTPEDELIVETARKLKVGQEEEQQPHEKIGIRYIQPHLQTKVTILIVDKKYSLAVELKDDTKQTSNEAIGLATYSNSLSTVLSYASIFESLWTQTELYQKLKEADKMKDEFINVAAHELRTPIQPILGLAHVLRSKQRHGKQEKEYLDVIIRNAKRLERLSEDILDITKIESKSLGLKKELFNLSEIILTAMADSNNQIAKENKDHSLKLQLVAHEEDIFVEADKGRINQVISNLLSNAIKFTKEGSITLAVEKKYNNLEILYRIQDTGTGIHPEILPRLFTKFASKSEIGTGLGLFISKSIIEAHGGKIWGENNPDGRGATFSFTLPLKENQ